MQGNLSNLEKKIITKAAQIQVKAIREIADDDLSDFVQEYLDLNIIDKSDFLEQLVDQMQFFEELAKFPEKIFLSDELYVMLICAAIIQRITKFPKTREILHRKLIMVGNIENKVNLN